MGSFQWTITALIALIAAVIAFGQYWTARQKLAFDLFEKRYGVYMDVRKIVSELSQLGKLSDPGLPNEVVARARFLFGKDVFDEVVRLHNICGKFEVGMKASEVHDFLRNVDPIFRQYIGMDLKLPGLPLIGRWKSSHRKLDLPVR